jgi:four helix bundle protein
MEYSEKNDFNPKFRIRTRQFAINLCKLFNKPQQGESTRVVVKQIIRSGTSVASNFYAATRARSIAEYYSKICIVVEECDETFFWLDLLKDADLIKEEKILELYKETEELLKVFSTTKKNLKIKLKPPKK